MAKTLDANAALNKWKAGVASGQAAYKTGIQNSDDWAQAAIDAGPARNAALISAINSGKIDDGIRNLGTAAWRSITAAKGPANWQNGVNNAGDKYMAGIQKSFGYIREGQAAIEGMPRGSFEQRMARYNAYANAVHNAKMRNG